MWGAFVSHFLLDCALKLYARFPRSFCVHQGAAFVLLLSHDLLHAWDKWREQGKPARCLDFGGMQTIGRCAENLQFLSNGLLNLSLCMWASCVLL